jgi:NAD(P)-dependent dehydrogenase (short-subunit alcohol dehydrogenase family)
VFVAGGSSDINLAIAQRFAQLGAKVGLISRKQEPIRAAAATIIDARGFAWGSKRTCAATGRWTELLACVRQEFGEIECGDLRCSGQFPRTGAWDVV